MTARGQAPLPARAVPFSVLYIAGLAMATRAGMPGADEPISGLPGFYDDRGDRLLYDRRDFLARLRALQQTIH